MTIGTRFAFAVGFLCLGSTLGQGGLRVDSNTTAESDQARRRTITYSDRSTIPPDPDSLPADEDTLKELAAKFGRWHFWDGEEEGRPDDDDMCKGYPSCDIPGDDFDEEVSAMEACLLLYFEETFIKISLIQYTLFNSNGKLTRSM